MATTGKTAEQMNAERRATKARQQAVAKAKALGNIKGRTEFTIKEAIDEKVKHDKRKAYAEKRGIENGNFFLDQAIKYRVLVLKKPDSWSHEAYNGPESEYMMTGKQKHYIDPEDVEQFQREWERNCNDVIAATKRNTEHKFTWNNDWFRTGRLMMAIVKPKQ